MISTGRRPKFWTPQRKPGPPHRIEFNPTGRLSNRLVSLVLFENCLPPHTVPSGLPMATRDYASPETSFTANDVSNKTTTSPYGGQSYSNLGTSTIDLISYNPAPAAPASAVWSASSLLKFDGIGGATYNGNVVWLCDPAITQGIAMDAASSQFTDFSSSGFLTPAVTTLNSWTRMTVTSTGSAINLYLNGVFQSTAALTTSFALGIICNGWPWPTADFFYWTRTLTAYDVLAHYADPYGTTMRPRWSPLGIVGSAAAIVGRRPSLLNLGVGP